jgi:colanic acid/amylovoran biosynthesis protein
MKKKNPKICLLGASFGATNMGVNALTAGTLKAFYERYPDGDLFLLDYGKEEVMYQFQICDRIVPVQLINIRFSKKFYLKNNVAFLIVFAMLVRCIPFHQIRKRMVIKNYWISRIAEADIVASMAGGDSFSDIYGLGRFIYVALPQLLALLMGKKLVLLPQTIGPFHGKFATYAAKFILKRANIIYSRDYDGIEVVRNLLGQRSDSSCKLRFCNDVGFVLDPVKSRNKGLDLSDQREKGIPVIGLNISGLLYMGGYTGNNMFGLKIDYKEFIRDLIDFMIKKKNAAVMLVPHVFGTHAESDAVVCEDVYASMKGQFDGRLLMARGEYNQNEIKYIIGLSDFFIGSRMHACIAALSQNVPTVSIAYSQKFVGVMQTIGVEELVADPRKLEKEEILGIIDNAFDRRDILRRQLEQTMPRVRETVLNLFNEIGSLLESR